MTRRFGQITVLAAALACLAAPAGAQDVGNPQAGRALAREWCADCHLVESGARGATDYAPPFAEIASDPKTTDFRLRTWLRTPHFRMPNFALSRDQTDDVVAYILSLRQK